MWPDLIVSRVFYYRVYILDGVWVYCDNNYDKGWTDILGKCFDIINKVREILEKFFLSEWNGLWLEMSQ